MNRLAFDRASVRTVDVDGRLHVAITPISKAQVSPYWGREIPDFDRLGLDPDRVYQVLRPAEELEKAAATFNGVPLLSVHTPTSANDHPKEVVIGSTGTDAVFQAPYLMNSLVVWDGEEIRKIEADEQKELSCGYHYTPVLESGTFEGQNYDIRMTNIIGNHVALVVEGRAGSDVSVHDENPFTKESTMKLTPQAHAVAGALRAFLTPLLAQDKTLPSLSALVKGVKAATYAQDKLTVAAAVRKHVTPLLAADASLADLDKVMDALTPEGEEAEEVAKDGDNEVVALLKQLLAKFEASPAAEDEIPVAEEPAKSEEAKTAMDQKTIDAALTGQREALQAQYRATQEIKPLVGDVDALAFDSAAGVYAYALKHAGIDPAKHEPAAYRGMVEVLVSTKTVQQTAPVMAVDAAADFPGLSRISRI